MDDRILHLSKKTASTIALFVLLAFMPGCTSNHIERNAVVEANPLSSASYHIEITGTNQIITFAYQTDVIDIDDCAQWNGIATVGAYNMAFQQSCLSVYSSTVQAKQWRGEWVYSATTSPKIQFTKWLQDYSLGSGSCDASAVLANSVLPLPLTDTRTVSTIHLPAAALDWDALCDVHIDSTFGSQNLLTDIASGDILLYIDNETLELIGATFTAQQDQTHISGMIIVSANDGQSLEPFPDADTITDGTQYLYEEWALAEP